MRRTCSAAPTRWRTARCWTWWSRWGHAVTGWLVLPHGRGVVQGQRRKRAAGRGGARAAGSGRLGCGVTDSKMGEQQQEQQLPDFFPPPPPSASVRAVLRHAAHQGAAGVRPPCVVCALPCIVCCQLPACCCAQPAVCELFLVAAQQYDLPPAPAPAQVQRAQRDAAHPRRAGPLHRGGVR